MQDHNKCTKIFICFLLQLAIFVSTTCEENCCKKYEDNANVSAFLDHSSTPCFKILSEYVDFKRH